MTLLAILIQFYVVVEGAEINAPAVAENFANLNVGDDYTVKGKYPYGNNRNVCIVCNDNDGRGNYLNYNGARFNGLDDNGNAATFSAAGISAPGVSGSEVTVKFDYKIAAGKKEGAHFYCGNTIQMELDASPFCYYNVQGQSTPSSVKAKGTISAGSWHEITAIISITNQNFDLFVDGVNIMDDAPFRQNTTVSKVSYFNLWMNNANYLNKDFSVANFRVYQGALVPQKLNDYADIVTANAEKPLVDLTQTAEVVKEALPDAYAMFEGYPMAYTAGKYDTVSDDKYLAPVLYDGNVFAPAGFVAKALGGTYSGGTITAGDKSFAFAEGVTSELCSAAPVTVGEELYIPVTNKLASYFGSSAFVDERGLAIIGISSTPGEQVIKSLLFELRNYSAIFAEGVKSEILFCSRSMYGERPDVKGGYESIDATKRFMSTSNRWTYQTEKNNIYKFRDAGSIVQSGLNARPVTVDKDENGKTVTVTVNGRTYSKYTAAVLNFDGSYYIRSDGLDGWGCVNNPLFLEDLVNTAKKAIDMGQYLWQFDDYPLNLSHCCYCDYCIEAFTKWLKEEQGCTTYKSLVDKYGASYTSAQYDTSIDNFNYKTYLTEVEGYTTNNNVNSYYSARTRMGKAYYNFNFAKVHKFHEDLRATMDEYAEAKGLKIFMTHNTSSTPNNLKTNCWLYDVMDGGMGETTPNLTGADGIFSTKLLKQAVDISYVNSLWVRQGKTTMQLWEAAVPLMYATGQFGLMPWDDWVYNSTRFFCTPEELSGNYSFVREYPELFDNYESPEEVGYIIDFDESDGLSNAELRAYSYALGRKGIASRFIAQRTKSSPYQSIDEQDLKGIKSVINVNSVELSDAEKALLGASETDVLGPLGIDGTFENGSKFMNASTSTSMKYAGSRSLNLSGSFLSGKDYTYTFTNLKANQTYQLSFYANAGSTIYGDQSLNVKIAENNTELASFGTGTLTANGTWVKKTATFTPSATGSSIKFTFSVGASDNIFIDNLELKEVLPSYTYASGTALNYHPAEADYWMSRIKASDGSLSDTMYTTLRKNTIYTNAPVVVHAVNFDSTIKKNVGVEINNKYLPEGDSLTIKIYAPQKDTYTKTVSKGGTGITTVTIDELDNWAVLEISGANTESIARFNVDGMSGMGLGSRISYDSASGTANDFTITTYGEGINTYTFSDSAAGQDEAGYVYKHITTDDFEVTARVEEISGESGIMIRDDVYSNAAAVTLSYSAEKGMRFGLRDSVNRAYIFKTIQIPENAKPEYFKITGENSVVTAWTSENGQDWTKHQSFDIYFTPHIAGAFASSADGTKVTCNVREFSLVGKNNQVEKTLDSINLFEGRNPSFHNELLLDYSAGYDGIWDSSLQGSTTDQKQADGKTAPDGTTAKVTRVITENQDGYGASVYITNRANGDEGLWYRYMPIENGKTYEVSCWAKVGSGVTDTASLTVQKPMADGKYSRQYNGKNTFTVDYAETATLSDNWTRVYTRFTVSETGYAHGIDVIFKTQGTSDVYLDNFEMREVHPLTDTINATFVDYGNKAVLEISGTNGNTEKIRYNAVTKKPDDLGVERIIAIDTRVLEITGATERIELTTASLGGTVEIQLWDASTNSPINRTFEFRRTK